mmetsp:Transcript_42514/g.74623  ORF Transcript_42514/g.74623 Transcript_42514/m.74623 type:complete len:487 (+) Transcript_42514:92-1552(+)
MSWLFITTIFWYVGLRASAPVLPGWRPSFPLTKESEELTATVLAKAASDGPASDAAGHLYPWPRLRKTSNNAAVLAAASEAERWINEHEGSSLKTGLAVRSSEVDLSDFSDVNAEDADDEFAQNVQLLVEAWEAIRNAPMPGPLDSGLQRGGWPVKREPVGLAARFQGLAESASGAEWYFLLIVALVVFAVDLVILQHLPEIERTHVGLFVFWVLIATAFCTEVWLRLGPRAGADWISGYMLEIVFSVENVFIAHLVFSTFETPRRLMRKALFVGILGSIFFRFLFLLGLAEFMYSFRVMPYLLGAWLLYFGVSHLFAARDEDEFADITQTKVVRVLRHCLGDRLCDFYDEEGEAVFVTSNGKVCMTMMGVVVLCLLSTDFFFGSDGIMVKSALISNGYVNFSSSVIALLTQRALFFVVRDIFTRISLARYGLGVIFFFVGVEMLAARFMYVSALMSFVIVVHVVVAAIAASALRDACPTKGKGVY